MYPSCHGKVWPASCFETGDRLHLQDFAQPGRHQSFPVGESDVKVGPRDVPEATWTENDQWAFQRDRAQAALLKEEIVASRRRVRAKEVVRDAALSTKIAQERVAEIEVVVEDRRRRSEEELLLMQSRVKEALRRKEEAVRECQARLGEGSCRFRERVVAHR